MRSRICLRAKEHYKRLCEDSRAPGPKDGTTANHSAVILTAIISPATQSPGRTHCGYRITL